MDTLLWCIGYLTWVYWILYFGVLDTYVYWILYFGVLNTLPGWIEYFTWVYWIFYLGVFETFPECIGCIYLFLHIFLTKVMMLEKFNILRE